MPSIHIALVGHTTNETNPRSNNPLLELTIEPSLTAGASPLVLHIGQHYTPLAILQQASENLTRERIGFTHCQLRRLKQDIQATQDNLQSTLSEEDWCKVDRFNESSSEFVFQTTRTRQMRKFKKLIPRNPTTNKPTRTLRPSNTVVNLSRRQLTKDEQQVLSLGLNFAVAPKQVNRKDFIQRIEPGLKHLSRSQADSVRIQITQALTSVNPTRPNLTTAEKSGISSLKEDNSIHILKADKGNATVVMDKEDYETKVHTLLDTDTYKKLPRDPTPALERRVNDKIHKPDIPLRPIVSTRGSPTYALAQHLASILQPLVGQTVHHVKNSKQFIDQVRQMTVSNIDLLISFDVESLFTSVPVKDACATILKRLDSDRTLPDRTKLSPTEIHDLLAVFASNSSD
ncbi:uncharacterized protein [Diadema antillarum]|uniref:uncharacterized protein n=1 Tax=Diadema antillarum TaxID=105358 RepID=UPI003A850A39